MYMYHRLYLVNFSRLFLAHFCRVELKGCGPREHTASVCNGDNVTQIMHRGVGDVLYICYTQRAHKSQCAH